MHVLMIQSYRSGVRPMEWWVEALMTMSTDMVQGYVSELLRGAVGASSMAFKVTIHPSTVEGRTDVFVAACYPASSFG